MSPIPILLSEYRREEVKFVLLHMLRVEDSITELLFMHRYIKPHELVSEEFKEACEVLETKYGSNMKIEIRFAMGHTKAYLANVLHAEGIDEIAVPEEYDLKLPSKRSVAMLPLLKRMDDYPLYYVPKQQISTTYATMSALNINEIELC